MQGKSRAATAGGREGFGDSRAGHQAGFSLVELLVVLGDYRNPDRHFDSGHQCGARAEQSHGLSFQSSPDWTWHNMYGVDHKRLILPADLRDPNFDNVNGRWGNWATILVQGHYLAAPDQTNPATPPAADSVFRCPDGIG
jgi:hypothetical protein